MTGVADEKAATRSIHLKRNHLGRKVITRSNSMGIRQFVAATGAIGLLALAGSAWATQTDNRGIHAVPTPGAVAVDGKLDDWDLSGQVLMCYDVETLKDVYSAKVAMMYDADNLYVAIHWTTANPMSNSHDPRYQANKGWAGDSVQLRMKTDRISHLTGWYYAAGKEPFIGISYGKSLTEPFGGGEKKLFQKQGWKLDEGAEEAFLKDADGKGYVQEIKVPWNLITNDKKYGAGDQFSCGVELLWGGADWPVHRYADNLAPGATSREFFWTAKDAWGPVFLEPKGHLTLPVPAYVKAMRQSEQTAGPVEIQYNLPAEARVTLAINDANGRRVRNLIPALPREAGKNVEHWDGLDDEGKPVPPGQYHWTGLYHETIHANWMMSFCNPGNPTWETPDGRGAFYGDHTPPQAAAAAGNYVALACPMAEAGKHVIGCDLNGQRLWGLPNRTAFDGGHVSLATDGTILWVAVEGKQDTIYRVEIATGKYAPWQKTAKDADGREFQVLDLLVSETPGGGKDFEAVAADPTHATLPSANLSAIAYHDGELAVCLSRENKIKVLDANTGDVKREVSIPSPASVAFNADGSLIALSQGQLVRIGADGKAVPFTEQRFATGYGVAVDAKGNVYLSVRDPDQNVKVFSPQGQLLREIGQRGGRPHNGPFVDNAMRNPGQIAIDSKGRLWVPEETKNPKRTSIWNTADGTLVKDLVGTTSYAGAGSINPYDPSMAFAENTVFKIDLDKGTWRPVYSLGATGQPDEVFHPSVHSITSRVMVHEGATYVFTSHRGGQSEITMGRDGQWRVAASVGMVPARIDPEHPSNFKHPLFKDHVGQAYAWADKNGDGLVQGDEVQFNKGLKLKAPYWGTLPQVDGTLDYFSDARTAVRLPITGYSPSGAPVYDIAHPQLQTLSQPSLSGGEGMIMGGGEGRIYFNQSPLTAIDKNGKVIFTYPSDHVSVHGSHTAKASRPGYLIGPSSILGTADLGGDIGEVFYLNGNLGENYLFTADGLYIQSLFKDTRGYFETPNQAIRHMPMDAITAGGESFGGNFICTPDGRCFVTIGGTDARVIEITGLQSIKRLSGEVSYTPALYAAAQEQLQKRAQESHAPKAYDIPRNSTPVVLDGKPAEWPGLLDEKQPAIEIAEDATHRYGRVQMRYDDQNLYLGYRIYSRHGRMRNAGQDYRLLFKSGDCVDLMLGSADVKAGEGMRLLFSPMGGKNTAVLYEKKARDQESASEPVPFASPWRKIFFARVTQPEDVKWATGPIAGGYFVEAKVPWSRLGIQPHPGLVLKGDVGVLFADNGGTITVSRQYWSNKNTGLVNDVPGEADLTPGAWGTFTLQK
jgi:DNA-binding beta-propeller fold protein YncE